MTKKIKIQLSPGKMGTRVWVDDKELKGVTDVKVRHAIDDVPHVEVTFIAEEVEIEGEAEDVVVRGA